MSRFGTSVDAVFAGGSVDAIISLTDSVPENDVRVCFFLAGEEVDDGNGSYVKVTAPTADPDDAVGMCLSSAEEGTEPSESDLELFHRNFDEGLLFMIDPYACEFNVYKVKGQKFSRAEILISE